MMMNHHNDIDPDADAIDTDYEQIREAVAVAAPDEPIPITVALRAVALERVDLERDGGETFADWIRTAVDEALEITGHSSRDDLRGQADYTPENDTPDEAIFEAHELAEYGDWIAVTVEFPARTLERIQEKHGVVAEWIRTAIRIRFQKINYDLGAAPKVTLDLSPEVAERAQLTALDRVAGEPAADYHAALRDVLLNMVQPQTEYRVGGDVIATFDEDIDVVDPRD